MNKPDATFLDGLLQILTEAPRTQIDEDIVADIKKFMSEEHTRDEKYNFIQNIANEPLNMINDKVGVGRITPFVAMICNLDATFNAPTIEPIEPIMSQVPEGFVRKYGWDGKPIICKDESDENEISIQYIVEHQDKHKDHDDVLVKIMGYMDDLMWANKFDIIDKFIEDFCNADICFQYCLCLLTTAHWAKDKLKNFELIKQKSIETGTKELGEEDMKNCLKGLL